MTRLDDRARANADRLHSGYRLRCAGCGGSFFELPVKWCEAIVLVRLGSERVLAHFEPCSVGLRERYRSMLRRRSA